MSGAGSSGAQVSAAAGEASWSTEPVEGHSPAPVSPGGAGTSALAATFGYPPGWSPRSSHGIGSTGRCGTSRAPGYTNGFCDSYGVEGAGSSGTEGVCGSAGVNPPNASG